MKRTRLRPMSAAKRAEIKVRTGIVRDSCALAGYGNCSGPIDKHEIVRRSQAKGAATDERLIIGICRSHHMLDEFKADALELGIRIDPHEWRLCAGDPVAEGILLMVAQARRELAVGREVEATARFVVWCEERGYDPADKAAELNLALCAVPSPTGDSSPNATCEGCGGEATHDTFDGVEHVWCAQCCPGDECS